MIIRLIFFLFLQTKPSFSRLFAWSQLDISAILDSVSAGSEGCLLNFCWILKLLSGPRFLKLLNLCGNQLISIPYCSCLLMPLFLLFLGKIFQQLNLRHFRFAGCYDNNHWYLVTNLAGHLDLAGFYFSKCPAKFATGPKSPHRLNICFCLGLNAHHP